MIKNLTIIYLLTWFFGLEGQVSETFNTGTDVSVVWQGDLEDFQISNNEELQLASMEGSRSFLYTDIIGRDSMEWSIYTRLEFAPSSSNRLQIYLYLDQPDIETANGYYLQVGETGDMDALHFYKLSNGKGDLLGSLTLGAMAEDPAEAEIEVTRSKEGKWEFSVDYNRDGLAIYEMPVTDNEHSIDIGYFGLYCRYTSTRRDKFFFDDLVVQEKGQDTSAPNLIRQEVIGEREIRLVFDEPLNETTARILSNYLVDNGLGSPTDVLWSSTIPSEITLRFADAFESGIEYTLDIRGVTDRAGNVFEGVSSFFKVEVPESAELILSEILFNPVTGGSDFVEVYNNSNKVLSLSNIFIANTDNDQSQEIVNPSFIRPQEYLVFSPNPDQLINHYPQHNPEAMVVSKLPALNNDDGNVSLALIDGFEIITLDSYDYDEDQHHVLIDDVNGVSLENASLDDLNSEWHSASQEVAFATPGLPNSAGLTGEGMDKNAVSFDKSTFSPNDDQVDDVLELNYVTDKPGYLLNIMVFDVNGQYVTKLTSNQLLSRKGTILWEGRDENQRKCAIGIYVLHIEMFHPDGDVFSDRKAVSLVDFLD